MKESKHLPVTLTAVVVALEEVSWHGRGDFPSSGPP